jgi:hypothetical protein
VIENQRKKPRIWTLFCRVRQVVHADTRSHSIDPGYHALHIGFAVDPIKFLDADALAEYVDEDAVSKGDIGGAASRAVHAQQSIGFGVTPKSTPVDEDDATMKNVRLILNLVEQMHDMNKSVPCRRCNK